MGRTLGIIFLVLNLIACQSQSDPSDKGSSSPNFIVILADDMGYSDISCYGGEIQTPHLDHLATQGVRFTQFYNAGRCCPSRASLLTGVYSHRAGVGFMSADYPHPSYRGFLSDSVQTIAEALKPAGYRSFMVGKWHVGTDAPYWPRQRGFDEFYGSNTSQGHYFRILEGRKLIYQDRELEAVPKGWYATNAFTDSAIAFMTRHEQKFADQPFFLYLAYTAPHWPIHALEEDIAMYQGKYAGGYDSVRQARYKRMVEMGLVEPEWNLSPLHEWVPSWDSVDRQKEDLKMAAYAAMIHRMDAGIGKLLVQLKELDIEEETLVMFLSDNGGCEETPGGRHDDPEAPIGTPASYRGIGPPWANVNNTPYRLFKRYTHEGGTSTPLIIRAPFLGLPEGELIQTTGHIIDIKPTLLDLAGLKTETGPKFKNLDGASIFPLERYDSLAPGRLFFWEHMGNRAVRQGDYKLVAKHREPWELYHITEDRTELNDLSNVHPELKAELLQHYQIWAKENYILPFDSLLSLPRNN